jgi:hypothetical protein
MSAIRALGLVSGGLDSTLAVRLMLEQGIDVIGVNFNTGFCISDTRRQVQRRKDADVNLRHEALRAGSDLGIPVEIVDVSPEYMEIVTNPRWGYGKNANPCIDCRIMMLRKAKAMMSDFGASFIFTGEVLGQRPMTQHRATLRQIEKQSDLLGHLLRPLSAQKLPETEAETRGWVDRSRLRGFYGRGRKAQLELAVQFGISDFPQPAGGCCFLTDPSFARKFFDFMQHRVSPEPVKLEDFLLLKIGRHLRLPAGIKLVLGRDEAENNYLETFKSGRWALRPLNTVGPLGLIENGIPADVLEQAARVLARYSDHGDHQQVEVLCESNGSSNTISAQPMSREEVARLIIT